MGWNFSSPLKQGGRSPLIKPIKIFAGGHADRLKKECHMKRIILVIFTLLQLNLWALEVAAPKAPPSIPLLKIDNIHLNLYQDVSTEGIPPIIKGLGDIYILPVNVGAKLYNKGAGVKLMGVTSNGLLSLVSSEVSDFDELQGKKLYIGGQGSSPDVITKKILKDRGVDAEISYRSSPEIAKLLMTGRIKNAILPEPLATMVLEKNNSLKRVDELKDLWNTDSIPQVGIFALEGTLKENRKEVEKFLKTYRKSLNDIGDRDIEGAIDEFNLKMEVGEFKKSMEYMNLTLSQDRDSVENYLNTLSLQVDGGFYGW